MSDTVPDWAVKEAREIRKAISVAIEHRYAKHAPNFSVDTDEPLATALVDLRRRTIEEAHQLAQVQPEIATAISALLDKPPHEKPDTPEHDR